MFGYKLYNTFRILFTVLNIYISSFIYVDIYIFYFKIIDCNLCSRDGGKIGKYVHKQYEIDKWYCFSDYDKYDRTLIRCIFY